MRAIRSLVTLAALPLVACAGAGERAPGDAGPVFAVQRAVEGEREVMEALYQGRVLEVGGCLRLESDGSHTVVWPPGFSLAARDGARAVLDPGGREIGRVGGAFRFGGGEVPASALPGVVDERMRELLLAQCPGRYWIVGDV